VSWSALDNIRTSKKGVPKQYYSTTTTSNAPIPKLLLMIETEQTKQNELKYFKRVIWSEENLPLNDFGKGELKESDHGIKNPVSKPLLIINMRFCLDCPNWGISVQTQPKLSNYHNILLTKRTMAGKGNKKKKKRKEGKEAGLTEDKQD